MSLNGTDMAGDIVNSMVSAGKYPGLNAAQIVTLKADLAVYCTAMVTYIVANIELNGVTIDTSTLLSAPTPLIPVINDGGAAVSAQMVGNADNKTINQNNGGTGLIS